MATHVIINNLFYRVIGHSTESAYFKALGKHPTCDITVRDNNTYQCDDCHVAGYLK